MLLLLVTLIKNDNIPDSYFVFKEIWLSIVTGSNNKTIISVNAVPFLNIPYLYNT